MEDNYDDNHNIVDNIDYDNEISLNNVDSDDGNKPVNDADDNVNHGSDEICTDANNDYNQWPWLL